MKKVCPLFAAIAGFASIHVGLYAQSIPAPTHIWTGASALNDQWQGNNDNWVGNAPSGAGNGSAVFWFGEADQYTAENLTPAYQMRNLIFAPDAGAYTLYGESLRVSSTSGEQSTRSVIYNWSSYLQTIENNLYLAANMTFDTGRAGILWTGNAESDVSSGSATIGKLGLGDLIVVGNLIPADQGLEGNNYRTLHFNVALGSLVMDGTAPGFAASASNVILSGGRLKIIGNSDGTTALNLGTLTPGANVASQLWVGGADGADIALTLSSWGGPGDMSSHNFYLASEGATVRILGALPSSGSSGYWKTVTVGEESTRVYLYATVTTTSMVDDVPVRRTGFAMVDADGYVRRYDQFEALPTSGTANGKYYSISGNQTMAAGTHTLQFLTIQAAEGEQTGGELTGASSILALSGGLLMEEGVGDYIISVGRLGPSGAGARIYIQQFSMDGDLIIRSPIGSGGNHYNNNNLVKSGPGRVIVESSNPQLMGSSTGGSISILDGWLQLDGSFEAAVQVSVRGGLSGRGSIGGGTAWNSGTTPEPGTGTRYTAVAIQAGGIIDASNVGQKALDITGSLTLSEVATYQMTLAKERGAALSIVTALNTDVAATLNGDLSLELEYAPGYGEWIVLLSTNGVIEGQFLTVNGAAFGGEEGNQLWLTYNGKEYEFLISYDYTGLGGGISAVAIQAIPEPSVVALYAGLLLVGGVSFRRWYSRTRKS
jgi:hypothetical protein